MSTENYGQLVASYCFRFLVVRKIGLRWSKVETPVAPFSRMRFVLSALRKGEKAALLSMALTVAKLGSCMGRNQIY